MLVSGFTFFGKYIWVLTSLFEKKSVLRTTGLKHEKCSVVNTSLWNVSIQSMYLWIIFHTIVSYEYIFILCTFANLINKKIAELYFHPRCNHKSKTDLYTSTARRWTDTGSRKNSVARRQWPTMVGRRRENVVARVQNEALSVSVAFKHTFQTYCNTHQDVKLNMTACFGIGPGFTVVSCVYKPVDKEQDSYLLWRERWDQTEFQKQKSNLLLKTTTIKEFITHNNNTNMLWQHKYVGSGVYNLLLTIKILKVFIYFYKWWLTKHISWDV